MVHQVPPEELTGVPQFRRTKYLFVYCEDRQLFDVASLLRGQAVLVPLRQILAISILTAKEHPISRADLALRGLVLSDEPDERLREFRRADEVLSSSQWNVYAALYHFLTKWHDVGVNL